MRILFLTTRLPFPPVGGERLRPFYMLKYLPADWPITLLSFIESEAENNILKDLCLPNVSVRTVRLPKYKSYIGCLRGIFSSKPLEMAYYASGQMQDLVGRELSSLKYDLVFCHLLRMAPYAEGIDNVKKVLDVSDALSLRYALSCRYRRGPFKFIEHIESKRLLQYEPEIYNRFDLNLIASGLDKHYLEGRLGVRRLEVLENGVAPDELENGPRRKDPGKIVFFGNMRTFHNIDAALYFYKEIFPQVKKRARQAQFVIVGANIPDCIARLKKDPSVAVFKDVPDMRVILADAAVSVAPMRIAVGIQNKILQSMAWGVPVVTTTLGLGGIQAEADKNIFLADNPPEFAAKVARLLEDDSLNEGVRNNALKLIREKYLWPNIVNNLSQRLIRLVAK